MWADLGDALSQQILGKVWAVLQKNDGIDLISKGLVVIFLMSFLIFGSREKLPEKLILLVTTMCKRMV